MAMDLARRYRRCIETVEKIRKSKPDLTKKIIFILFLNLKMTYKSHPTAIIDEGVTIGKNCSIWHFSHICKGAKIGDNVSIGQNVFVEIRLLLETIAKFKIMSLYMMKLL